MVWAVSLPVRVLQLNVRGAAEAMPPGKATAASEAEPARAAQTTSRIGSLNDRFMLGFPPSKES